MWTFSHSNDIQGILLQHEPRQAISPANLELLRWLDDNSTRRNFFGDVAASSLVGSSPGAGSSNALSRLFHANAASCSGVGTIEADFGEFFCFHLSAPLIL